MENRIMIDKNAELFVQQQGIIKILKMYNKYFHQSLASICLCFFLIFSFSFESAIAQDITINGVRFGVPNEKTRFVIDSKAAIKPSIFMLDSPRRLVIDIPNAKWQATSMPDPKGVITKYRYGQWKPNIFRIVLELNSPVKIEKLFTLAPNSGFEYRTVLDLKPATQAVFLTEVAELKKNRVATKPSKIASSKGPKVVKTKRIIIIDPGHGGHDPGNLGVVGKYEKNVVLAIAKDMKRALDASGRYDVRLTRNTDFYIDHRERYRIAQRIDADLFISVHADSFTNKQANGGTIYTLAERSSDKETALLVRQHNDTGAIGGLDFETESPEVIPILADLTMRQKMNASAQFAEILLPELRKRVNMKKIGHRSGPFLVLKDPVVPAILLETGYLSNKKDAKFITSTNGRKKLAAAMSKAVDIYFRQLAQLGR